ncbi:hypothetical protein [Xanthomonas translucens]|uniref:Uncharacterized protein n=2 Tax=Xanthomonas campestris pv. translucens TaxID=343 RepID=A0A109HRR7_XANCT|nr:hypothetical protein [Xanthomonas translucens]KWV17174.1 hypothetical protein ATB53_00400 [Xanthomonas translucens]QSQ34667.1 hypothetical protein ISN31_03310 [Xanthomonas translucens pv. translucens]
MDITKGKTYTLKTRRGRAVVGQEKAKVTGLVAQGRGHTVHYTVDGEARTASLGEFSRKAA